MNIELTASDNHYNLRIAIAKGIMVKDDLQAVANAFDSCLTDLVENLERDVTDLKKKLPKFFLPAPTRSTKVEQEIEPSSEAMTILKAVLSECTQLPISKINAGDTILSLGVDSIMALQVSYKLRGKGYLIGSAEIIESTSLRSLAARLSSARDNGDATRVDHVPSQESKESTSLKPTAGILWFVGAALSGDSGGFQHGFPYQIINERLDSARARITWRNLVDRHVLLRTSFVCDDDGNVRLSTAESAEPNWTEISYTHIFEETPWIQQFVYNLISRPMDPRSPPARCTLLHLANHDYLVFEMHHFQYGG
jgi:ferricrocin synthase